MDRIAGTLFVVATLFAATAFAADPERADDPIGSRAVGVAIAGGLGSAYDLLGFHLELSSPKAAFFLGTGLPVIVARDPKPGSAHYDLAAGVRFFSGQRDRLVVSLQTTWSLAGDRATDDTGQTFGDPYHLKSAGATVGWRWRHEHAFFELGGGFMFIQFGPGCEGCQFYWPLPDLMLAGGYQF